MQATELLYRKSATEGGSGFGWLIALYDTLAGNLRRAADADRNNNLEMRCQEVNHALMVIGYLEDCMERASGGELAAQLVSLYSSLRRKLIEAQVKRSPQILEQQMERVLRIRESWQTMEYSRPALQPSIAETLGQEDQERMQPSASSCSMNWSA